MKPSVGSLVQYQAAEACRAAVVLGVYSDPAEKETVVSLCVFEEARTRENFCVTRYISNVRYAETPTPNCWSWPDELKLLREDIESLEREKEDLRWEIKELWQEVRRLKYE